MSDPRTRKDLPYLREYLATRAAHPPIRRGLWRNGSGCGVMAALFAVQFAAAYTVLSPVWAFVLAFPLFLPIAGGLVAAIDAKMQQPKTDEERHQVRVHALASRISNAGKRKIQKEVDPIAAQILEACALHRSRIIAALQGVRWGQQAESAHWKAIREQSLKAADEAMEEALILCEPFIGKDRGRNEEEEWRRVVADFLDGSVGNALGRAGELIRGEPAPMPRSVDEIPRPLRPAYEVALKMKSLAGEVESAVDRAQRESPNTVASSIDNALHNLQAVKQAERELDEDPLRQNLSQGL